MPHLKDQIQNAMDEVRTLVLGTQVLLGFQYQSVLEPGFAKFAYADQRVALIGLGFLIANFVVLLIPAAHHLLVFRGDDTPAELDLIDRCAAVAAGFFAAALAMGLYLSFLNTTGNLSAAAIGAAGALTAVACWYVPWKGRKSRASAGTEVNVTAIHDKIRHVLTETRVVLPGAQALLGFSYVSTLMDGFAELPISARIVHLGSLAAVTIAVILLMAPAAYHRIVEGGEETEGFHRLASRLLIAALVPLAMALSGEVFVVVTKVLQSDGVATALALVSAAMFGAAWFGFPLWRRNKVKKRELGSL